MQDPRKSWCHVPLDFVSSPVILKVFYNITVTTTNLNLKRLSQFMV